MLVSTRGARRVRGSHPWVFRDDVAEAAGAAHGDVVQVMDPARRPLGMAFFSAHSKITLRMLGAGARTGAPRLDELVDAALAARRGIEEATDAWRVLFAESDGIPGLVVDRYGTHLVVQALTAGAERVLPGVLDRIAEHLPVHSVLARNDPSVRALEGLPREVRQVRGSTPRDLLVHEGEVRFHVDCWTGQKTGAFLDQRDNRMAAARRARGRVLDVFSYHGSFALHAARAGAEVEAVDTSEEALARGRDNAALNGVTVRFTAANAFDDLRARAARGDRYDMVLVDPPAFAKRRADVTAARRGYKEINLRAMRLLGPGGMLVSSSCSYHMSETDLLDVLTEAAADAGCAFHVVERRTQARDHPIRLGFPESHYLKCLMLRLM